MTITINYQPISPKDHRSFSGGASTSFERLLLASGSNILDASSVPVLRAMALAADDKFYDEVADAIEKFGEIKIWEAY